MTSENFKILLIDDSDAINEMNAYFFKECMDDVEIVTAKNGKDALAILENPDSIKTPDLVLLDLKMPVFDGYEFLEYLSVIESSVQDQLKVVLLTTSMNPKDKERISKFPIVLDYLAKPLTMNKVSELVNTYLKQKG